MENEEYESQYKEMSIEDVSYLPESIVSKDTEVKKRRPKGRPSYPNVVEARRQMVARLAATGMSHAEIRSRLMELGHYNKDTDLPFSLGTIAGDLKIIRRRWKQRAFADYSAIIAETLATIEAVQQEAWKEGNWDIVLKAIEKKMKLLGLNAPDVVIQVDWRSQIIQLLRQGMVTVDDIRETFGQTIASEFDDTRNISSGDGRSYREDVVEGEFKEG